MASIRWDKNTCCSTLGGGTRAPASVFSAPLNYIQPSHPPKPFVYGYLVNAPTPRWKVGAIAELWSFRLGSPPLDSQLQSRCPPSLLLPPVYVEWFVQAPSGTFSVLWCQT